MPKKIPSISEVKAFLDRAKAYKEQFHPSDFYHASPSNKIKIFDPASARKGEELTTPGVSFFSPNPTWADKNFLPVGNEGYKTGATMYPVKIKMGKHFDPSSSEAVKEIEQYATQRIASEMTPETIANLNSVAPGYADVVAKEMFDTYTKGINTGAWDLVESPAFLEHLRKQKYDTFAVNELGQKGNIGVLEPHNIRGKFAEFNPDEAMNPDFMKAEGGAVEGYAPGGRVGALTELMQLVKQRGGSAAAKRLEKAADLVPNLEHQFKPEALKSAFAGDNASAVMVMRPNDFEKYAAPISMEHKLSPTKGYGIGNAENFESYADMPKGTYQDYIDYLSQYSAPGGGGFNTVPYLQLNKDPKRIFPNIAGHEGRHRTAALTKQGAPTTLIQMMPRSDLREGLPRGSQEEYLDALIEKIGNRPAVKPQTFFDPTTEKEVSRGLIDLPEMFSAGGEVAKKALEFAKSIPFVHFSKASNISRLEPAMYGTGIRGAEGVRLQDAPDIRPRSYFYTDRPDVRPEQGLGNVKYSGVSEASYPLHEDPAGYYKLAKELAKDPFFAKQGVEIIDRPKMLNEVERAIKKAGYTGYHTDDAGILFHPTEVNKATD